MCISTCAFLQCSQRDVGATEASPRTMHLHKKSPSCLHLYLQLPQLQSLYWWGLIVTRFVNKICQQDSQDSTHFINLALQSIKAVHILCSIVVEMFLKTAMKSVFKEVNATTGGKDSGIYLYRLSRYRIYSGLCATSCRSCVIWRCVGSSSVCTLSSVSSAIVHVCPSRSFSLSAAGLTNSVWIVNTESAAVQLCSVVFM